MADSERIIRLIKKRINAILKDVQWEIDKGCVYENQGYDQEMKVEKLIAVYSKYLRYPEICGLKKYFYDGVNKLDYSRKGVSSGLRGI